MPVIDLSVQSSCTRGVKLNVVFFSFWHSQPGVGGISISSSSSCQFYGNIDSKNSSTSSVEDFSYEMKYRQGRV